MIRRRVSWAAAAGIALAALGALVGQFRRPYVDLDWLDDEPRDQAAPARQADYLVGPEGSEFYVDGEVRHLDGPAGVKAGPGFVRFYGVAGDQIWPSS